MKFSSTSKQMVFNGGNMINLSLWRFMLKVAHGIFLGVIQDSQIFLRNKSIASHKNNSRENFLSTLIPDSISTWEEYGEIEWVPVASTFEEWAAKFRT